jgi:hypothetical protein
MSLTPIGLDMITAIGAKKVYGDDMIDNPTSALTWLTEAVALLLLREIERAAMEDGVDVSDLMESVEKHGAAEMRAAAQDRTKDQSH